MFRKTVLLVLLFSLLFQGVALALEGDIIFRDSLYGATIGALIGLGLYAIDQNDLGAKVGGGVVGGVAVGVLVGVAESRAMVSVDDGTVVVGVPSPRILRDGSGLAVRTPLLDLSF